MVDGIDYFMLYPKYLRRVHHRCFHLSYTHFVENSVAVVLFHLQYFRSNVLIRASRKYSILS